MSKPKPPAVAFIEPLETRALLAQSPFPSTAAALPGTIEAENYDKGGEGVAYHDTTAGSVTAVYRNDGVDVERGGSNGYNVGHIRAGEWLEWTVKVGSSGTYRFETVVASKNSGGKFRISVDGSNKTGSLTLPYTGGWHTWKTVSKSGISLAGGTHVLRLTVESSASGGDVGNIDLLRIIRTSTTTTDFNPKPLTWTSKATNPLRREEAQSLVFGGKLYSLGGYYQDFKAAYRVDAYDPLTNTWSRKRDMPNSYNVTHAAVVPDPDGHTFWFIGGFIGDFQHNPPLGPPATNRVYKYDAAADTWTAARSLPVAHGAGGAGIINNKLYFFSGADQTRSFDRKEAYVLDLHNQSAGWNRIADMPFARNHLGGIVANGKLYAVGGQFKLEDESIATNLVHRYNPSTNTWEAMAPMPFALSHFNASTVLFDRYIITVGGENPHNTARPYVLAYDTVLNRWARMTDLPNPRRAGVAGLIGTRLIQSTGYLQSQGQTATTYIADLANVFA